MQIFYNVSTMLQYKVQETHEASDESMTIESEHQESTSEPFDVKYWRRPSLARLSLLL